MANASPPAEKSISALRAILPFARGQKALIFGAFIALLVASGATLSLPIGARLLIDAGFGPNPSGSIATAFILMGAVVVVLALSSAARYYQVTVLGERVVADLRAAVFEKLLALSPGFYDTAHSGELVSRLTADTTLIKSAFGASASIALRNAFLLIGAVVMMTLTSSTLSGMVLAAIPLIVLPLVGFGRLVSRRSRHAQDTLAATAALAADAISSMRTVQAATAEQAMAGQYAAATERAYLDARHATRARAALTAGALFLIFGSILAILWWGAQDVAAGRMTTGTLGQFVLYAVFAAGALSELSQVSAEIAQAAGAAGRLGELMHTAPMITSPGRPVLLPVPPRGEVVFRNVTFAYPSRPETHVLKGLDLRIRPGETVALVGPSGAGKSTVLQLLLRFYDPKGGEVMVDGVDISRAALDDLRKRIALVPQEPAIFAATVRDNLRFGAPEASNDAVVEAARQAAAHDFIRALPLGYDTPIGERGLTLSGGQRQRLAIARAILRDAPLLLLDEATSALDAESETLVQEALTRLMRARTTLVIAHRLATVQNADRIVVLDNGRVVEEGNHESLSASGGLYARLARLQFRV